MSLHHNSLAVTLCAFLNILGRVRSRSVTMGTNDFARYFELDVSKMKLGESTHLYRSPCIHIRQADFQIRQKSRSSLLLLALTCRQPQSLWIELTSTKKPRKDVIRISAPLLLSFVLLQTFLASAVVYCPRLVLVLRLDLKRTSSSDKTSYADNQL